MRNKMKLVEEMLLNNQSLIMNSLAFLLSDKIHDYEKEGREIFKKQIDELQDAVDENFKLLRSVQTDERN